jgi:hypothetical protein
MISFGLPECINPLEHYQKVFLLLKVSTPILLGLTWKKYAEKIFPSLQ